MTKLKIIFLLLPFIGLFGLVMYYANFVENATSVTLPVQGYDPRNLLSGHYIQFQIDWKNADCQQANWNGSCPKSSFVGVNRFYVPEDKAKLLERLINQQNVSAQVVFAYQKGKKAIVKDLLIDGKNWKDYIHSK